MTPEDKFIDIIKTMIDYTYETVENIDLHNMGDCTNYWKVKEKIVKENFIYSFMVIGQ